MSENKVSTTRRYVGGRHTIDEAISFIKSNCGFLYSGKIEDFSVVIANNPKDPTGPKAYRATLVAINVNRQTLSRHPSSVILSDDGPDEIAAVEALLQRTQQMAWTRLEKMPEYEGRVNAAVTSTANAGKSQTPAAKKSLFEDFPDDYF